jgi:predicted permease
MRPPRLARALIERLLPTDRRAFVVGDLDEEFRAHIVPSRSRWRAAIWYWRQAIASLPHALRLRRPRRVEATHDVRAAGGLWRGIGADVVFGFRLARRRPGHSLAVFATLTIGIAVSSAVVSVAYAVLARPLPYREPDRLVAVAERQRERQASGNVSWPDYLDYRRESRTLRSIAGYTGGSRAITGVDTPDRVAMAQVTDNFFATLGVTPALGRDFVTADMESGAAGVVVITDGAWRRRFGGDPNVVGRQIQLDAQPTTIVGVLPAEFQFPLRGRAELFLPVQLSQAQRERRYFHWLDLIGRLQPETTVERATAELTAIAGGFAAADATYHRSSFAEAIPLAELTVGNVRPVLLALVAASSLLLLIACMNVAGLAMSRADARARELDVRAAIGASRWRMARQLVVENVAVAAPACAAAVLFAHALVAAFVGSIPPGLRVSLPHVDRIGLDPIVAIWAMAVSAAGTIAFGLAPAVRLGGRRITGVLRGEVGETMAAGRVRAGFVGVQVAIALVLLATAGLMVQSVTRLASRSHGFDLDGLFTMQVTLPASRYSAADRVLDVHATLLDQLDALPAATGAATIDQLPLEGRGNTGMFRIEGATADHAEPIRVRTVSRGYFEIMGIPLRAGRRFAAHDRRGAPRVLIVNETLAASAFGGEAVGKRVAFPFFDGQPMWEIVGVVGDERFDGVDRPMAPAAYFSFDQIPENNFAVVVRTTGDPAGLERHARSVVTGLERDAPPYALGAMAAIVGASPALFQRRAVEWLLGAFAATALVLVAIGLYGIVAQTVAAREREIGLRLALGADARQVLGMVMRRGLVPAAFGLLVGLGGAVAAASSLSSVLFAIEPTDPATLTTVSAILAGTAMVACLVPARRVLRIDPIASLRQE